MAVPGRCSNPWLSVTSGREQTLGRDVLNVSYVPEEDISHLACSKIWAKERTRLVHVIMA
jgi:hypothetical protein